VAESMQTGPASWQGFSQRQGFSEVLHSAASGMSNLSLGHSDNPQWLAASVVVAAVGARPTSIGVIQETDRTVSARSSGR
jgi:hypothetical protein